MSIVIITISHTHTLTYYSLLFVNNIYCAPRNNLTKIFCNNYTYLLLLYFSRNAGALREKYVLGLWMAVVNRHYLDTRIIGHTMLSNIRWDYDEEFVCCNHHNITHTHAYKFHILIIKNAQTKSFSTWYSCEINIWQVG